MKLFNSRTQRIEPFVPMSPPWVSMYVCGVTVYDYCHLGHARAYVTFDTLKRVLIHHGYNVRHIQNFTDIDDKIIDKAHHQNESIEALTQRYISAYHEDLTALNILPATTYPLATEHIPNMIQLIEQLIQKKAAYVVNGSVYFRISSAPQYGALSNKTIDDLQAGHRVDVDQKKESPLDFILWKPAKLGEPFWESPWGRGRPGWHTECVAMVDSLLGPHIDIHGGGTDLKFPHHENELAQASCAYNTPFANVWIHNGFVTTNHQKMSKSLGNFFTLRDVLKTTSAGALRFFLMRTHYRSPLSYSLEALSDAISAYRKLTSVFDIIPDAPIPSDLSHTFTAISDQFWKAWSNDLNASDAISQLFELHGLIHQHGCGSSLLQTLGSAIGLFFTESCQVPQHIHALAEKRWSAKKAKDFNTADDLRNAIALEGFIIEDTPEGFRVRKSN